MPAAVSKDRKGPRVIRGRGVKEAPPDLPAPLVRRVIPDREAIWVREVSQGRKATRARRARPDRAGFQALPDFGS